MNKTPTYHFSLSAALFVGLITALAATVAAVVSGKQDEHAPDALESWDDVLGI
jgi:hypothetical protein